MKNISKISNDNLLKKFSMVISREREAIVDVIVHLAEIAKRKLCAREGYSNIYTYLQKTFHYSGSAAFRRMQAVKLSSRFPEVLTYLAQGKLNLTSICLIEPHVTFSNGKKIVNQVLGKTKQEIEVFLTDTFQVKPKQMQDKMRHLPVIKKRVMVLGGKDGVLNLSKSSENSAAKNSIKNSHIAKLDRPENVHYQTVEIRRVKVEFVVDEKVAKKVERAKDLFRAKYPKGRLEDILNEALDALLDKKDPERKIERAQRKEVRQKEQVMKTHTRYMSAHLRQEVWKRDRGHCTFVSPSGKHCGERGNLHLDHVHPFALGGKHSKENLRLLCRTHNLYRAQQTFGVSQRQ